MIKLWSDNEVITLDNVEYLNEAASKRFYNILGSMLDNTNMDNYVLLNEAKNIIDDLDNTMFEDVCRIYESEYANGELLVGKDAFECVKKIGLSLISNGYPSELLTSKTLGSYGKRLTAKYNNIEFNDDFTYYEILLDGLKNNNETKLMLQCDEIWGINLILKLCKKYNLSNNKINPEDIDNWLFKHGYKNDKNKTEKFLKALSEMLISPDDYLCGCDITSYFTKKYDISSAIKHAMDDNKPVYLEEYEKSKFCSAKKVSISSIDAYDVIIKLFEKEFSNEKLIEDIEVFNFINEVPKKLMKEGIPSNLIRGLKIKEIQSRLNAKYNNFKLNEADFELYLKILNGGNINSLINEVKSTAQIYRILYYSNKLNKEVNDIDFNLVLNKCDDIISLINFIKVSKNYLNSFSNLTSENVDRWLEENKYYELDKNTESLLYLFSELPKFVAHSNYFYEKFDVSGAIKDYNANNIKPFSTYNRSNIVEDKVEEEINESDVLQIVDRRNTSKLEKKETLIVGSGIISFLMVSFVTKKNPVQVAHNFQQITNASELSDKIGNFGEYITSIVHIYTNMIENNMVDERRRVR